MRFFIPLALLGSMLLAGCVPQQVRLDQTSPEQLWQQRQLALAQISQWDVKGRIGVVMPDQGWHASLHWQQQEDAYEIRLAGPVGQGAVRIFGDKNGVSLLVPREAIVHASSAEQLLQENLGWSLPVEAVRFWARGLPAKDDHGREVLDEQGRMVELRQDGWHIVFSRYGTVAGVELPGKLVLERRDMKIKLILANWSPVIVGN